MDVAPCTVVVAGEALVDLVPTGARGELRSHPGGGPFNTARALGRLGRPVAYLGRLSTDRFGSELQSLLRADGVALDCVIHTDDPTTLAMADLDADGAASYRFYARGTSAPGLTAADTLAALPADVAALHVGSLALVLEPIATAIETMLAHVTSDALVLVDPNVRPAAIADPDAYRARLRRLLRRADVLKASAEDIAWLAPGEPSADAVRALLARGPAVGLLTRGPAGATVVTPTSELPVAAPRATVVDTIGAGDAFGAAFLAWWHERGLGRGDLARAELLTAAVAFACAVAAQRCARAGADPPRRSDLVLI